VAINGVTLANVERVEFLHRPDPKTVPVGEIAALRVVRRFSGISGGSSPLLALRGQAVRAANGTAASVTLIFYDASGAEAGRLELAACVPTAWGGPDLSARGDVPSFTESSELSCTSAVAKGAF
jgi:hypothetical protein